MPEILRTPLDRLVLQVKAMKVPGDVNMDPNTKESNPSPSAFDMLCNCIDPPTGTHCDAKSQWIEYLRIFPFYFRGCCVSCGEVSGADPGSGS